MDDGQAVGEGGVDFGDPGRGFVVEPAVCPDRAVDPVDEAKLRRERSGR